jgi:hypothetical protein
VKLQPSSIQQRHITDLISASYLPLFPLFHPFLHLYSCNHSISSQRLKYLDRTASATRSYSNGSPSTSPNLARFAHAQSPFPNPYRPSSLHSERFSGSSSRRKYGQVNSRLPRRFILAAILFCGLIAVLWIAAFRLEDDHDIRISQATKSGSSKNEAASDGADVLNLGLAPGKAIAEKLGNETAKAELGRAAWKVMHTTFARFPDKPTDEEKSALKQYIHLFQRLYPW